MDVNTIKLIPLIMSLGSLVFAAGVFVSMVKVKLPALQKSIEEKKVALQKEIEEKRAALQKEIDQQKEANKATQSAFSDHKKQNEGFIKTIFENIKAFNSDNFSSINRHLEQIEQNREKSQKDREEYIKEFTQLKTQLSNQTQLINELRTELKEEKQWSRKT